MKNNPREHHRERYETQKSKLSKSDITREVEKVSGRALEHAVWHKIKPRINELYNIGALPTQNSDAVRTIIQHAFAAYEAADKGSDRDDAYHALAELLVLSGIAQPSTLSDWSIDRMHEAEKALGIESFQILERTLGEAIANPDDVRTRRESRCRHLHKGPGNGALMYYLRKGREGRLGPKPHPELRAEDRMFVGTDHEKQRTDYWAEYGVGDRVYFSIDGLLQKFVRPDKQGDPKARAVIRVLSMALQHALRAHWFDEVQEPDTMAPNLVRKRIVDLNDIILLLAEPNTWISDIGLFSRRKCFVSKEFERDDIASLEADSDEWLLRYAGWENSKVLRAVRSRRIEFLKSGLTEINMLCTDMNLRDRNKLEIPDDAVLQRATEIFVRYRLQSNKPETVSDIREALKHACTEINASRRQYDNKAKKKGTELTTQGADTPPEPLARQKASSPLDCLSEIFNDSLVEGVKAHDLYKAENYRTQEPALDLNRVGPEMYLHNFVPGKFSQLEKQFPAESFTLITATRSDSHESNEEFGKDIVGNLKLMEEGGVLLTDGIRQSGSRVYRFRQVQEAIGSSKDFRAEVIMHRETHEPLSILIQKRHPTAVNGGFLTDEQKQKFLRKDSYLVPLPQAIERRPDLQILNDIRLRIIKLAGGNLQIFQQLHQTLLKELDVKLTSAAVGRSATFHDVITEAVVEEIRTALSAKRNAALGTRLDTTPPPDKSLIESTFYEMREKLMKKFNATDRDHVRKTYDTVLHQILSKHVFHAMYPDETECPVTSERQEDFESEMFASARNILYLEKPILRSKDIAEIIREIGDSLQPLLTSKPERKTGIPVISGLEQLSPNSIHALQRRHTAQSDYNRHNEVGFSELPSNDFCTSLDAGPRLERKKTELRKHLSSLGRFLSVPPLTLVKFADCATNECLAERMREILGEAHCNLMTELNVAFNPSAEHPEKAIRHFVSHGKRSLQKRLDVGSGGIFVVGGSWNDAYDRMGSVYKDNFGSLILDAVERKKSRHRLLAICFGAQTTADLLGKRHGKDYIRTEPGAMEFCPSPIHIEERSHPIFRDFPPRISLMQTHSGHVFGLDNANSHSTIRPIARRSLTGLPTAYDAAGGKIFGIQAHPEVPINKREDRERLITELAQFDTGLGKTFGVTSKDFNTMWANAAQHIKGEAGTELLCNGLLAHTKSLLGIKD